MNQSAQSVIDELASKFGAASDTVRPLAETVFLETQNAALIWMVIGFSVFAFCSSICVWCYGKATADRCGATTSDYFPVSLIAGFVGLMSLIPTFSQIDVLLKPATHTISAMFGN